MGCDNKVLDKYYKDYINGINIDNIEFSVFNYEELQEFFRKYYYDEDLNQFAYWEDAGFICPYGMHYLEFNTHNKKNSYLLGTVDNQSGKKTIAFCMEYDENYQFRYDASEKIIYILFIETNYFLRNRGILKRAFNYVREMFRNNDMIIISPESSMGSKISLFQRMVDLFSDINVSVNNYKYGYSLVRKNSK